MKRKIFTKLRKEAEEETVGKRAHLYEHTPGRIVYANLGGPLNNVPVQLYSFTLHPECTRAVYRAKKRAYLRARRATTGVLKRYRTGFGSRARARGESYGPTRTEMDIHPGN